MRGIGKLLGFVITTIILSDFIFLPILIGLVVSSDLPLKGLVVQPLFHVSSLVLFGYVSYVAWFKKGVTLKRKQRE